MTSPFGTEPLGGLSPEELLLALEAARAGTFRVDLKTRELRWSASLSTLYGLGPGEAPSTFEDFLGLIHPDDRDRLAADVRRAIEDGVPYSTEIRAVWPDGSVHWLHGAARRVEGAEGRPTGRLGAARPLGAQPGAPAPPPARRYAPSSTRSAPRRRSAWRSSTRRCATCASTRRWRGSAARASGSISGGRSATSSRRRSAGSSRRACARRARPAGS